MAILKKTAKAEQAVAVAEAAVKSAAVEQAPAAVKEEKPASKTTRKASAKKAPAAKKTDAPKVSLTLQYLGKELTQEAMVEAVKAQWTGADSRPWRCTSSLRTTPCTMWSMARAPARSSCKRSKPRKKPSGEAVHPHIRRVFRVLPGTASRRIEYPMPSGSAPTAWGVVSSIRVPASEGRAWNGRRPFPGREAPTRGVLAPHHGGGPGPGSPAPGGVPPW